MTDKITPSNAVSVSVREDFYECGFVEPKLSVLQNSNKFAQQWQRRLAAFPSM